MRAYGSGAILVNRYHKSMEALNVLPPSIEPHAQDVDWTDWIGKEILNNGYAYESEGSVLDVAEYNGSSLR